MYHIIVSLLVLLSLEGAQTSGYREGYVWQGFSHKWERNILGIFQTPHRVGSIANRIIEQTDESTGNVTAKAKFTMTPGVNGDYAHPKMFYQYFRYPSTAVLHHLNIDLSLTGHDMVNTTGEYHDHNEANITLRSTASLKEFVNLELDQLENITAVLNGFEVQMKCLDEECNSNGIWPFHFKISIGEMDQDSYQMPITVEIGRGWTPSHGGVKPLNKQMQFIVTVPLKFFYFQQGGDAIYLQRDFQFKRNITDKQSLRYAVNHYNDIDYSNTITGLHQIGFTLLWNSNQANRGRYIEQFEQYIEKDDIMSSGLHKLYFQQGVLSPSLTTYEEEVQYELGYTTIDLHNRNSPVVSQTQSVEGSICINDWSSLFWCKFVDMDEKTTDFLDIKKSFEELTENFLNPNDTIIEYEKKAKHFIQQSDQKQFLQG